MFWILLAILLTLTGFGVGWAMTTIIPVKEATAKGAAATVYKAVAWVLAIVVWFEGLVESATFKLAGVAEPVAVGPVEAVAEATLVAAQQAAAKAATLQAAATTAAAKAAAMASASKA